MGIACDLKKTIAYFDGHYLINTGQFECGQAWRFPVYQTLELRAGLNYRDRFFQGFGMKINTGKFTIDYGGAFYPYNLGMINTIGIGFAF